MARVDVVIESGKKRTFASALDWPGWARAATSHDEALDALEAYRERYAGVLRAAHLGAPTGALAVREVLVGNATTDFGAPAAIAERDHRALRAVDRDRLAAILVACWSRFEEVASAAGPLRTGPRGGGRQAEAMRRHVAEAELAYARGLDRSVPFDRDGKWPLRYAVRRIAWHACDHLFEIEDRAAPR
jgi:hypothetical protein